MYFRLNKSLKINMDKPFKFLNKIRVEAGSFIPRGSWYGPIQKDDICTEPESSNQRTEDAVKIMSKLGVLYPETRCLTPWYHHVKPARDIHEQNVTLLRASDNNLYLQAIKDISPGEIITWWYDETLTWDLSVPYLTPAHILGIGRYCCLSCQKEFTFPNHLKLHIMNKCIRPQAQSSPILPIDVKGHKEKLDAVHKGNVFQNNFNQRYTIDLKKEPNERIQTQLPQCASKPHGPCLSGYKLKASFELVPKVHRLFPDSELYSNECENTQRFEKYRYFDKVTYSETDEDEPMEILKKTYSVMSSNKGHLCVFCGKLYSRKYGLKIHLRTHTGYKPLKCKVCHRAFGDPSNLNKHIRLHAQGGTPYQCTYCGKVLVRRRDLVRHLKSRHPNEDS